MLAEVWVTLGAMGELMGPPFSQHNHKYLPSMNGFWSSLTYPLVPKNGTRIIPQNPCTVPQMD